MSAVSKWLTPASRAASTTAFDASSSMRMPKLLQPSPATETSSDPTLRVSIMSIAYLSRVVGLTLPGTAPTGPRAAAR